MNLSAGRHKFTSTDMPYMTLAVASVLNAFGFQLFDSVACSSFDILLYIVSSAKLFGVLFSLTSCQQSKFLQNASKISKASWN